ncbi:MAG: cryptochrome/photolyase family protein, partial [Winogradskyella sp.]|nr:cryptochrome/photolyase family protein [Winogradskyella sp.]
PHQLFKNAPILNTDCDVYLIEEFLFFNHYKFHKQKIAFHRATMKAYEAYLKSKNKTVNYIEAHTERSDVRKLIANCIDNGIEKLHITEPTDNWLQKRINSVASTIAI